MFDKFFKKKKEVEETPLAIRALATLQQGNYPEALRLLNEYITMLEGLSQPLTDDDGVYYYNRSIAKVGVNDIDGAIEDLNKCVKLAQLHQAYFELFKLHNHKGRDRQSLDALIKAYECGSQEAETILRENTNYFN
jgi:tetratricopeptide (TPR) repeat protein